MKFVQPLRGAAADLFEYAADIPVIDTHEHIPRCEADYNNATIAFGNLFNPYVSNDLTSAGMDFPRGTWAAFHCISDDWDAFEPYWRASKFTSYARPIRIALQKYYGVDDFTRENYLEIVKRINENNTPGIYHRILREDCGIEKSIRCAGDLPDQDDPILVGNVTCPALQCQTWNGVADMAMAVGMEPPASVDDVITAGDAWMELMVSKGAIQFKCAAMPMDTAAKEEAEAVLQALKNGEQLSDVAARPLVIHVRERNMRKAAELGVPMAFHTGVWNDFRTVNVEDLIGLISRHPDTRVDLYHLGIPNVRSMVQVVKNYQNAYLNLCWAHVVASDMVVNTMKEAVDMVPLNKVFAFGADYVLFIEKVYGHLLMAKENISIVLGDRVDRNLMDLDEAKETLRAWFYDNPKAFYGL